MELVEWLLEVLDEDERREHGKRTFTKDYWDRPCPECGDPATGIGLTDPTIQHDDDRMCYVSQETYDEFNGVAPNPDPAVLADIAAKRAIIELHQDDSWDDTDEGWRALDAAVKLLASAYAHRDGFDPSWA